MPMCPTSGAGTEPGRSGASHYTFKQFPFPLGFSFTDTAMSICCAPRTCSGRAGVLGSGAQPSAGVAFRLAAGLARTGPTVPAAMW